MLYNYPDFFCVGGPFVITLTHLMDLWMLLQVNTCTDATDRAHAAGKI